MKKGVVIDLMCQKCFVKFCAGDSSLCDALWLSRPVELDSDHTETLTENNQHYTMREIAGILKISKSSVENHLHQFGYVYFSDVCVPHKLSGEKNTNFLDYTSICNFLLKHNERFLLLKHIVTGNEKEILHDPVEQKKSCSKQNEPPATTPKAGLHPKKVKLCICWDWKGVLCCEPLPEKELIIKQLIPTDTVPS